MLGNVPIWLEHALHTGSVVPSLKGRADIRDLPFGGKTLTEGGRREPSRTCDITGKGGGNRGGMLRSVD